MSEGYIYILRNPAYSQFLKIGRAKDPYERAKELSSDTGVPEKFEVVYHVKVTECEVVEKWVHEKLSPYRREKEFFEISPNEAKIIILKEIVNLKERNFEEKVEKYQNISQNKKITKEFLQKLLQSALETLEQEYHLYPRRYAIALLQAGLELLEQKDLLQTNWETLEPTEKLMLESLEKIAKESDKQKSDKQKIMKIIQKHSPISRTDLMRKVSRKINKQNLDMVIDTLLTSNEIKVTLNVRGGRIYSIF